MAADGAGSGSGRSAADVHDARSNALYAMSKRIAGHFPQVPVISSSALKRRMDDPLLSGSLCLVDVRMPEEQQVSMLPGSLTAAEFDARREELKGRTVVCYCTVGYRSSSHASKLRQQGVDAKNLEGGIIRWAQKRLPLVERGSGREVQRVHAYGKQWALAPEDYEQVTFKSTFLATLRSLLPSWMGGRKG